MSHPKADAEKRLLFQNKIQRYQLTSRPLVYLDESGFAHDMPRTHGYSFKGEGCHGTQDWGARGRTNAIGALLDNSLLSVSLFDGTINSDVFEGWVEQDLLPKLPPHSVIIMDNAAFHKKTSTKQLIDNAGHTLEFLPPYSPDLNPIEHKWAQAKAIRRQHQCSINELFQKYCT